MSSDTFYNNPEITRVFPITRLQKNTFGNFFHLNDNDIEPRKKSAEFDKLYKLIPINTELNVIFQNETENSSRQSIDERMVKFKG